MSAPEDLLIDYIVEMQSRRLDSEVEEKAVHLLLDALSLARSAADHDVVTAVRTVAGHGGGARDWGTGQSISVLDAALVNGTATHAFFQDDTDMNAWGHPASLIVPAVVAAGEAAGASLDLVLRGLVAGYSAFAWLAAREEVARSLVESGLRASPTLGSPAAAMGVSVVLGLDREQTLNALGIAADSTGGTLEPVRDGAQDWRLQNGFAGQRGTIAALLAQAGVRGPSQPLMGARGLLDVLAHTSDVPAQWRESPSDDALLEVWFKPYPILGDNMAPAVAASTLVERVGSRDVYRIVIRMNAHFASYPGTQFQGPFTRTEQMIASTAFNVATLLTHGPFAYSDYQRLIDDASVLARVQVTEIEPRHDYGYLDGTVVVETHDGTFEADASDAPREVFFRDRAETRTVLGRRHSTGLPQLADALFSAADGTTLWPSLADTLDAVVDAHAR